MTELADLADTLATLARPGIVVEHADGELVFRVLSPSVPGSDLVVFAARPIDDNWVDRRSSVIRSFDEFNDLVALMVDRATEQDEAMVLSQDLYNKGIMLNSHGWIDVLDFALRDVDLDIGHWLKASPDGRTAPGVDDE